MADVKKTTGKAPAKAAGKKPAAKKAAATKDTSETRTATAQKAAPLKAGATHAAATDKTGSGDFKDRALTKARSAASQGKERTGSAIESLSNRRDGRGCARLRPQEPGGRDRCRSGSRISRVPSDQIRDG